jgi:hypothetical protein
MVGPQFEFVGGDLMIDTDQVCTKEDFVQFVYKLRDIYRSDRSKWQNDTLDTYLEALAGRAEDMDGAYLNWNKEVPKDINWNVIAKMLVAASIYD